MVYVQNDHPDGRGDIMRQLLRHHMVHHRVQTLAIIAVLYDRGSQGARKYPNCDVWETEPFLGGATSNYKRTSDQNGVSRTKLGMSKTFRFLQVQHRR